ncbi:hypothetical protein JNW88_08160 [Micromonospora sp. ATA32]|nr:hypothetical protein [Micromonospora sp. ATA32]
MQAIATNRRLIAYTARTDSGTTTGIATVLTGRTRPTWAECAEQIPGYITGQDMGAPTLYTLRYRTAAGQVERQLDAVGVERIGRVVMRVRSASDIAVLDAAGGDVTFDFACFRN